MKRLLTAVILFAASAFAADISGSWTFTVETSQGSGSPSFEFTQKGETVTGKYSGLLGKADVSGTVKGDQIEFTFTPKGEYDVGKVTYKGTVVGATKMKGTMSAGALGEGTWEGVKK